MKTIIDFIASGNVTSPKGFCAGATYTGIKKEARDGLGLGILSSEAHNLHGLGLSLPILVRDCKPLSRVLEGVPLLKKLEVRFAQNLFNLEVKELATIGWSDYDCGIGTSASAGYGDGILIGLY